MDDAPRYAFIQRLLHWVLAVLVIGALSVGMIFAILEFDGTLETFGKDTTDLLYKYHKTFGVIILALMIVRLVVKLMLGKPAHADPLTKFQRAASEAIHGLFYVGLIAMTIVGWLATGASGYPVEFFNWTLPPILSKDKELGETLYEIHGTLGWIMLILVIVHLGAALMHWLVLRDRVMARMSLF